MTVPAPTNPETIPAPAAEPARFFTADIDRSCRGPVLLLLTAAAIWLGIGSVLGVITAIKAHAPGFLAAWSWLTYGRVRPAGANALVYGFALQAGLGMALWMICRLGRNLLQGPRILGAAAGLWNIGLLIGFVGILSGGTTSYEWMEMPGAASPILFCAWILAGIWTVINLHVRQERVLYPSQWFLLAGLLWFPWVYSTAQLLLVFFPVRGVMQAVVNGWYAHNLFEICLASFGLAAVFYLVPKLCGRPLYSRSLVMFGFWLWVLFGGWGGARAGEPVPSWISGVSVVARVFLLVPALAFAISWFATASKHWRSVESGLTARFVQIGALGYLLAAILETVGTHPALSKWTIFTIYDDGVAQLKIHGFLAMSLAGALYYIAPRLTGRDWPSARLVRIHFWGAAVGTSLMVASLIIGGLVQGAGINQPQTEFMKVVRSTLPFLGMNTLGATLLCVGYAALIVNFARLLAASCSCSLNWSWLKPPEAPSAVNAERGALR